MQHITSFAEDYLLIFGQINNQLNCPLCKIGKYDTLYFFNVENTQKIN